MMKTQLILCTITLLLLSCDSSVKADFDTIKAKKVILIGEDNKEYLLQVKNDSSGNAVLNILPNTK